MKDIVLWYDDDFFGNCVYQDMTFGCRDIVHKLKINNINFSIKNTKKDTIDLSKNNVYVIELYNVNKDYDFFSLIPKKTKKLFQQGLNLILYYNEGNSLEEWFYKIYQNLKKNDLIKNQIYFSYSDYDIEENYLNFIKKYKIDSFLRPIFLNWDEGEYLENVDTSNLSIDSNKKYDFLFYNAKIRPHRLYAVADLWNRNLLQKGLVSLIATNYQPNSFDLNHCIEILKSNNAYHTFIDNYVKKFKPLILDVQQNNFSKQNVYNTIENHYKETFFSIVSETGLDTRFITEKTYKAIHNCHPFIIIGCKGSLKLLRQRGFQTFSEMFDESYDEESNHELRIIKVINEVEKFSNLNFLEKKKIFQKVTDKIIHNREHYLRTARQNQKEEYLRLFKIISSTPFG